MKLTQFVTSMLPKIERSQLREDISQLREELNTTTLPALTSLAKQYKGWAFKAAESKEFAKEFDRRVKTKYRGNYVEVSFEIFRKAGENLDIIGDLIDKSMSNAVLKEGLTYRKASIIQYLEVFGFAQRYVRKLMLFTCACESAFLGTGKSAKEQFVPGDLKWMKANQDNFIQVMGILAGNPKQTRTTFEEIPDDIVLSQDKHDIVATTVGVSKLDPFNFGFIPVRFNPFYYVRMMVVEWQVKRYQAAVEERQAIELRILQLRAAADGKKDAALENQIEIVEGRLQKLNGWIEEKNEEYGL